MLDQLLSILVDGLWVAHSFDEVIEEGQKLREVEEDAMPAGHSLDEVTFIEEGRGDGDCMFDVDWLELSVNAELGIIALQVLQFYGGLFGLEDGVVVAVYREEEACF